MNINAEWKDDMPRFRRAFDKARRRALTAAGHVLVNEIKKDLRGGYTSGDFVTGASMAAVTVSAPAKGPDGILGVRVGTPLMYNLYWELGHQNLYTGRFERKEIWVPAAVRMSDAVAATFGRVVREQVEREMRR